VKTERTRIL